LKARQQRLEREQKERAEESKRRAERHRAIAERQRKRQEELEEEKRLRRIEELAAAEKVAQEREELISRNNGVFLETRLRAVATDEELLTGKGIKRAADKIVLPASVGEELMSMDAPKNGAMMFELRTPSGSVTHAGVLEFTAPAGTALLPPKVIRSLWGREAAQPVGTVQVRYKVLEKGTFARLQPATTAFQADCAGEVKEVLERALLRHSCLTEGDWIQVWSAGKAYDLRVESLEPSGAVSIIETDVEAEVAPSMENEAEVAAAEEAARRRVDAEAEAERQRQAAEEAEAAQRAAREQEAEKVRQETEAALPAEPSPSEAEPSLLTNCLVRLPNGARSSRRFRLADDAALLFRWVDSLSGTGLAPGKYRLVALHPRRVLEPGSAPGRDLRAAGLASGQEALFAEPEDT